MRSTNDASSNHQASNQANRGYPVTTFSSSGGHHGGAVPGGAPAATGQPARRSVLPRYIQPGSQPANSQQPMQQPHTRPPCVSPSPQQPQSLACSSQPWLPTPAAPSTAAIAAAPPAAAAAPSVVSAAAAQAAAAPRPPVNTVVVVPSNVMLVSRRQLGNPVLNLIKNVRWEFADIAPDYMVGQTAAVLFLSLRYHLLHPDYIVHRLKAVQRAYRLVVLLVHVDVEEVVAPLAEITKAAINCDATLVCAWSSQECARYLETFKSYENKPASSIQERGDTDYMGRLTTALTSIHGVNRSDAYTMAARFDSVADLFKASREQLAACPGLGPVKVQRLLEAFKEPFRKTLTTVLHAAEEELPTVTGAAEEAAGTATAAGVALRMGAASCARVATEQQQQVPGSLDAAAAAAALPQSATLASSAARSGQQQHDQEFAQQPGTKGEAVGSGLLHGATDSSEVVHQLGTAVARSGATAMQLQEAVSQGKAAVRDMAGSEEDVELELAEGALLQYSLAMPMDEGLVDSDDFEEF